MDVGASIRAMRYATAIGVGVLTAIATAGLWVVVRFVLPIALSFVRVRSATNKVGAGAGGAVISSGSILLAAFAGFVGGVAWTLWRR